MTTQRIAFLGAPGSFSEEAALLHAARLGQEYTLAGARDPAAVLAELAAGRADLAVLPIANTTGGLVRASLEALATADCTVVDELTLPVRFALWGRGADLPLARIEAVASHPLAFAQCARFLERELPGRARLARSDTASAARDLAAGALGERTAVLASSRAGARYGLALVRTDVHDDPANRTFFAVLAARDGAPR